MSIITYFDKKGKVRNYNTETGENYLLNSSDIFILDWIAENEEELLLQTNYIVNKHEIISIEHN